MNDPTSFRTLFEKLSAKNEVYKVKLSVPVNQLADVFSKETMELHYGTLYGNYVRKALAGEGEFQVAGAKLHTLFFEQFQEAKSTNKPVGESLTLINNKFGSYKVFKDTFIETAMDIKGSGWAYLDTKGNIKTIANHKDVSDVCILIDCWEHAYQSTYGADKDIYLRNVWKIINWNVANKRLGE